MSVTASKLGTTPLRIDWSNLNAGGMGTGRASQIGPDPEELGAAWNTLKARFAANEVGFYDAPITAELNQADASQALAERILGTGQFTDCLFLGIGGSSLGPLSLLAALEDRRKSAIRFHFMENPDPLDWNSTIRKLKPETTLVCVVAKSGTTFETIAQLLLALDWLGEARWRSHVVAVTDPKKGDLRLFAQNKQIPTLDIAPSIGGRFSIFSPVGLFAAALAGLSVEEFLLGAKQVRDTIEKGGLEKNPIFILASEVLRHGMKHPIHVCMPYSTRLRTIGDWFVQLWGESIGKDGKGFTPLAALGATDQHSILQLLRDGPNDKITFFITVDQVGNEVKIPQSPVALPAFKILEGHSLHDLLRYEYQATSLVLTKQGRPNLTIQLDQLDERAMGALYFTMAVLTSVTGTLMGVNPFDQPGVEEGKVYIRRSLERETGPVEA